MATEGDSGARGVDDRFGGSEALVSGDPGVGRGRVAGLVDVAHAGVTIVEARFRRTGMGPFAIRPPAVRGNGVGGWSASIGPGVDPSWVGARVITA
jgi:NADPH2:quinone reductase